MKAPTLKYSIHTHSQCHVCYMLDNMINVGKGGGGGNSFCSKGGLKWEGEVVQGGRGLLCREGDNFAGEGDNFAGEGDSFAGEGDNFAGEGDNFAGEGDNFAGEGDNFAGEGEGGYLCRRGGGGKVCRRVGQTLKWGGG